MSDKVIALMIAIALIALIFAWVPFLSLVCPPGTRFLRRRRLQQKDAGKKAANTVRPRPPSARRIGLRPLDLDN
jgi:hypothetical protein